LEGDKMDLNKRLEKVKRERVDFDNMKAKLSEMPYEEFYHLMLQKTDEIHQL
jgi:hypothetical protein